MMVSIARAMLVLQTLLLLTLFSSASTLGDGAGEDGEATGPRSASPGDGSHEREVCLRRLDELWVGSGGLEFRAWGLGLGLMRLGEEGIYLRRESPPAPVLHFPPEARPASVDKPRARDSRSRVTRSLEVLFLLHLLLLHLPASMRRRGG